MTEAVEQVYKGAVFLGELTGPCLKSTGNQMVLRSCGRRAQNTHLHLLSSGLMERFQEEEEELMAVVGGNVGEMLI
jgi:hypothetical protein